MRILGIDPGSKITGWGLIGSYTTGIEHIAHGELKAPCKLSLDRRVDRLLMQYRELLDEHNPGLVVMEEPHFRGAKMLNAMRALDAVKWSFRTATIYPDWKTYSASEIKRSVSSGKATKQQVIWSIAAIFGIPPTTEHEADALAAAICAANRIPVGAS